MKQLTGLVPDKKSSTKLNRLLNFFPEIKPKTTNRLPHMPQLDGLRAFAVTAVLIHHFIRGGWRLGANLGVKLFFVLSGFLITSILIRSRNEADVLNKGGGGALKNFYIRRFLRIFPLYYFVVAVGALVNAEMVREYLPFLLTYTLNFKMAQQGWFIAHYAHFWTLSVEEHFYLIWPWVVLFLPRRWLIPAALTMIALGPGYRLYHVIGWTYFDSQASGLNTYIFTLTCFDTLGMGALLALLSHADISSKKLLRLLSHIILPAGILGFICLYTVKKFTPNWPYDLVLFDLTLALVFMWLVRAGARGFGGILGAILNWKPIRYVGKISYGIYVYHPLIPSLLAFLIGQLGWEFKLFTLPGFCLATIATFFVASTSWYLMEKPINNLKRHFP